MVVDSAEEGIVTGDPTGLWEQHHKNWRECKLWDLATYINGKAFKPTDFSAVGLPVIKITELKYGISPATNLYAGDYEEKYLLKTGDLLFAWSGNPETSLDAFRWSGGEALLNQHIFRVIPQDGIDQTYLFFLLKYLRRTFIRTARDKATSMGHVKISDLKRLIAFIPPFSEQKAIASILGALDDKIELNRKMNGTLEAMARAIFKSWFVDFDPIPGLGPHKEWQDSPLGRIPRGWRVGQISDVANITSGKRPDDRASIRTEELKIPLYGGGGQMGFVKEPLFEEPILLTGRVGTLGQVHRITFPCWPSDNTLILIPPNGNLYEFLYFCLKSIDFESLNRGSTQPLVTQSDLNNYNVILPFDDILSNFSNAVAPLFGKIDINNKQSHTLAYTRDALLPKLLSGEIRVKDAERFVEQTI